MPRAATSVETIELGTVRAASDVLVIKGLVKRREQGGVAFELTVPSLGLPRGAFVAIVGESGCGKSTLLDHIALVMEPTECGSFEFRFGTAPPLDVKALWTAGDERKLASIRRNHLGYVLQTGGLLPFLTVKQNIELPARLKGCADHGHELRLLAERFGVDQHFSI